jgi:hypothetical protein
MQEARYTDDEPAACFLSKQQPGTKNCYIEKKYMQKKTGNQLPDSPSSP